MPLQLCGWYSIHVSSQYWTGMLLPERDLSLCCLFYEQSRSMVPGMASRPRHYSIVHSF
jgi:hypothetical protein